MAERNPADDARKSQREDREPAPPPTADERPKTSARDLLADEAPSGTFRIPRL